MGSKHTDLERVDFGLSDRANWVLRLLYTPNSNGRAEPVYGRTRIMKAMFLVQRKLEEEFNDNAGFDFKAYKYGPFDQQVYEALEDLELKKLITKTEPQNHSSPQDEPKYELTEKGEMKAEELYEPLDARKKDLLKWVKYQQANRPLGSLLSYVYRKYPDMTTESEIADRVSN